MPATTAATRPDAATRHDKSPSVSRRLRRVGLFAAALAVAAATTVAVAHQASAATKQQVRVVTANLEFHGAAVVRGDWKAISADADIVFLQEAKNVAMRDVVGPGWLVRQDTSSDDKQGSAVVIRRSIIKTVGAFALVPGVGGQPKPCEIMTRWIATVNVQLTNGRWLRVASLHMPPPRCQTGPGGPYDTMADNVVTFGNRTNRLTVLAADWNKVVDQDPNDIGGRTGLKPRGPDGPPNRIDGFYVSPTIGTCCLHYLKPIHSDHVPVHMTISVPAP